MDLTKVTNLFFSGIDNFDYPDFCDMYASSGDYDGKKMTQKQLDELNDNHRDFVYEKFMEN